MKRRRVKITGIGPVTPAGVGREAFWNGILSGASFVRPYKKLSEELGDFVAAQVSNFDVRRFLSDFDLPRGSARHTEFAVAGTILALKDAGILRPELVQNRCAIVTGSSLLDFGGIGNAIESVRSKGVRSAQARVVYTTTLTSISAVISELCGITAKTLTVQTSCCAGLDAIGLAADLIARGEADLAICGGTEAPLHKFPMLELRAAGLTPHTIELAAQISRPFDRWRTTGVVSEGACMMVLESDSSSRPGYAYISGYGSSIDDSGELCSGLLTAGKEAIAKAHLHPGDIDAISAWGPGHQLIDRAEACVLRRLFGQYLFKVPAVSIKGAVGSALGAAPAIQVGCACLGLRYGIIPGTVNWEYPDPACPLNLSKSLRYVSHELALVNAHGVGEVNSTLILQRC